MTRSKIVPSFAALCAASAVCVSAGGAANADTSVTTYHYDNLRSGWNQAETALTQTNVGSSSFKRLKVVSLDDQVDAQPLVVSGQAIKGHSARDIVYVATESNSVYAIDASKGKILHQVNLGTPVPYTALPGQCNNNGPNVGINSTPVIDPASGLLYVVALTYDNSKPTFRIHALSLSTLKDAVKPVVISAKGALTPSGKYKFDASVSRQRAALLLANGNVYAGFASFCDIAANQSRGWVLGWQAGTLAPLASNELNNKRTSSPDDFFLTSVWMSGYGLAASSSGSIYFVTGNSDYSGTTYNAVTNISESAAQMTSDLSSVQSLFTPSNYVDLEESDGDFGSGGLMLLPPQSGATPNLAAAAGKDGNLYLLDADNLSNELGSYQVGGCWCGPSFFTGSDGVGRVVTSGGNNVGIWQVNTSGSQAKLVFQNQTGGVAGGQDPGFLTTVSSNGTTAGTAVIWAMGRPTDNDPANIDLYAFNADSGSTLFSGVAGSWPNTGGNANIVPVVANGKVYVAADQTLAIFGLGNGAPAKLPFVAGTDTRAKLAPGRHEIYGKAISIAASEITIETRDKKRVSIEMADAMRTSHFAQPSVGHALIARGSFDPKGVLRADTILHAKDSSALWPSDR